MTREKCKQKVKDILIYKNPYGIYHQQNFKTYEAYGEMAPINSSIINDMPNAKIVLSDSVYEMLLAIQEATLQTNQEFPFFLYGQEIANNLIEFNEFVSVSANRSSAEASFNQTMINNLESKIKENLNRSFVICHGHSHPPIGNFHQNFSLGDFTSFVQMNENNPIFKSRKVELVGALVTSTGDVNFVFYDNLNQNFYRFTKVFVKNKDNKYMSINCYGLNQLQQEDNIIR